MKHAPICSECKAPYVPNCHGHGWKQGCSCVEKSDSHMPWPPCAVCVQCGKPYVMQAGDPWLAHKNCHCDISTLMKGADPEKIKHDVDHPSETAREELLRIVVEEQIKTPEGRAKIAKSQLEVPRQDSEAFSGYVTAWVKMEAEERRKRYDSVPHVDPENLKPGDRVVFNNDNRWTCSSLVACTCECGKSHKGWIMRHRSETQMWWFNETNLWVNSVMLKDWSAKKKIMDKWREEMLASIHKEKK